MIDVKTFAYDNWPGCIIVPQEATKDSRLYKVLWNNCVFYIGYVDIEYNLLLEKFFTDFNGLVILLRERHGTLDISTNIGDEEPVPFNSCVVGKTSIFIYLNPETANIDKANRYITAYAYDSRSLVKRLQGLAI